MDWLEIFAGVLLILTPFNYRWQMGKIRKRLRERGGNVDAFDTRMARFHVFVFWICPALGLLVVILGLTGG